VSTWFVEWMMGLPSGWVCDMGLSRTQELKMLGNGVVPQQAAAAYGWLLEQIGEKEWIG
jgi:DNA (cytosine-5)-methyltransferase 1